MSNLNLRKLLEYSHGHGPLMHAWLNKYPNIQLIPDKTILNKQQTIY